MTTQEHLTQAIVTLQQASAADMAGETHSSIELYTAAIERLEEVLILLPLNCRAPVTHHVASARHRLGELRAEKEKKFHSALPRFTNEFVAQTPPQGIESPFMCPAASVNRPFWLMQLLSRSMQTGAFLSPDLYVSKQVWYQEGAASCVRHIGSKVRCLSAFCDIMEPMTVIGNSLHDSTLVLKHLDTFLKQAEEIRAAFAAERGRSSTGGHGGLPSQKSLLERGVTTLLSKGSNMLWGKRANHDGSYNSYLAWAANTLEQGLLFDRWLAYFMQQGSTQKNIGPIFERLHRVSATLFFGCCSFLLHDAFLLTERYADKGRESAARLLPCEVKIDE